MADSVDRMLLLTDSVSRTPAPTLLLPKAAASCRTTRVRWRSLMTVHSISVPSESGSTPVSVGSNTQVPVPLPSPEAPLVASVES